MRTPLMVFAVIAVNCIVLTITLTSGMEALIFQEHGFVPANPHLAALFTSMFLHGSVFHLLGNMWFLWLFGPDVEDAFGHLAFAATYVLCGLGGITLHWIMNPASTLPCVGASGAVSGIAGIYFVLFAKSRLTFRYYFWWYELFSLSLSARVYVGIWIVTQVIAAIATQGSDRPGVAFWAHVGSFVTGLVAGAVYLSVVPKERRDFKPVSREEVIKAWVDRQSRTWRRAA
jgi:membrane associated rhomboid family serine protease